MNCLVKIVPHSNYVQLVEHLEGRILNGEFPENSSHE
jgi:hypothetical protein